MNNIAIISGSHRAGGTSHLVAAKIVDILARDLPTCVAEVLSLSDIPFWDEGLGGDETLSDKWSIWQAMAGRLRRADGLVIISPEYGGMVPPRLTNFLLLCSGEEIGHKPALAVAISSSRGGAYPIAQLRSFGFKNNHVCWLPDHLIVRDVDDTGGPELLAGTGYVGRYALYCLKLLDGYASALKVVRSSGLVDNESFPYGM
jgi:azobenzene reductase